MKRFLSTVAMAALLVGFGSMTASAHGGPHQGGFHGPAHGGFHGPSHGPGRGPGHGPGWGHGPGRWHGPEHSWGRGWDRHVYHGAWFWYGSSILWWDGGLYVPVVQVYDPETGMYYFVRGGVRIWLR